MERAELRQRLLECLGGPWPEPCELNPRMAPCQQMDGYRIGKVSYEVEPGDRINAYLLLPDSTNSARLPAVAVWHQHAGQYPLGKSEPAGVDGNPMHHTGVALAREGYVVLCPDALCFEERQDPTGKQRDGNYERFEFLRYVVAGKCLAWKNILDMRRGIDFLVSLPEVDAERIGCYGHSMGSTHSWLVGPWEERLKCVVCNCCMPTYEAIHREHMLHCFPNFIPGFHAFGDTPDIAALIAPRALHMNFGETDAGSPIDEVERGVARIREVYEELNAANRFSSHIEAGAGHVLSPEMWRLTREWFSRWLR